MNNHLHPIFQQALAPFAPGATTATRHPAPPLRTAERQAIDAAMHADKLIDGYGQRNYLAALIQQMKGPAA